MAVGWLNKVSSGLLDEHDQPVQYWFTYDVGTLVTKVHLATNQYNWTGDMASEASSVLLEPVMPVQHTEEFMASEYSQWEQVCDFWANKN